MSSETLHIRLKEHKDIPFWKDQPKKGDFVCFTHDRNNGVFSAVQQPELHIDDEWQICGGIVNSSMDRWAGNAYDIQLTYLHGANSIIRLDKDAKVAFTNITYRMHRSLCGFIRSVIDKCRRQCNMIEVFCPRLRWDVLDATGMLDSTLRKGDSIYVPAYGLTTYPELFEHKFIIRMVNNQASILNDMAQQLRIICHKC